MKTIVFDGDFHEVEVDWLKEDSDDNDSEADYFASQGFRPHPTRIATVEASHRSMEIYGHTNLSKRAWMVSVESAYDCFSFLIEGDVNYLKFLASPLCSNVDTVEAILNIQLVLRRLFRVLHEHDAPDKDYPSFPETSCSECDPDGANSRHSVIERRYKRDRKLAEERRGSST